MLLLVVAFVCALHSVVFAHPRYRLPLMPVLTVYAGGGVHATRSRHAWRIDRRRLWPLAASLPRWRWASGRRSSSCGTPRSSDDCWDWIGIVIEAVLFDVDGTLYLQSRLRALMAGELATVPWLQHAPWRVGRLANR